MNAMATHGQRARTNVEAREAEILGKPQRIPPLTPEEIDDETAALIIDVYSIFGIEKTADIPSFYRLALKHPGLFRCQLEIARQLAGRGELSPRDRELTILCCGWRCGAPFEWGEHVDIAKRCDVTPEEIERVTHGSSAAGWSNHDRAIMKGVEELIDDQYISDETWRTLAKTWNEIQLIEFPQLVGQYFLTALQQNSLRVRLHEGNIGLRRR